MNKFFLFLSFVVYSSSALFCQYTEPADSALKKKKLDDIIVVGNRSDFRLEGEKKIFDVAQSISGIGGTAVDVIRNIPSLDVDASGKVTYRGQSPRIFIDDKPTDLALDEIPTSDIERIEIISMPSAKYAASSGAGILNVVLKKTINKGYKGTLGLRVNRLAGFRAVANIEYGISDKWALSLRAFYQQDKRESDQHIERINFSPDPARANVSYRSEGDNRSDRSSFFLSPGIRYKLNEKATLSLSGRFVIGDFNSTNITRTLFDSSAYGRQPFEQRRSSKNNGEVNIYTADLRFEQLMKDPTSKWSAQARFQQSDNSRPTLVETDGKNQSATNDGTNRSLLLASDFSLALGKTMRLEFGGQFDIRDIGYQTDYYDNGVLNAPNSSAYSNTEWIGGLYASLSHHIKKFSYQASLRIESSSFFARINNQNISYQIDYPAVLFPSLSLQYEPSKESQLQLMYSYKIDRPNFFQTVPIKDYTDPLNVSRGNPDLKPSFLHLAEFTYSRSFVSLNNSSLLFSLYFRHTEGLITSYYKEYADGDGKTEIVITPDNSGNAQSAGFEITPRLVITDWYTVAPNFNLLYANIYLNDGKKTTNTSNVSYFIKLNQNFQLKRNWRLQLIAKYNSRAILPPNSDASNNRRGGPPEIGGTAQGYIDPFFTLDFGVEKSWKKKIFVSFNINDILGTNYRKIRTLASIIDQYSSTLTNPYFASINVRYVFGGQTRQTKRQKKSGNKEEPEEDGGERLF